MQENEIQDADQLFLKELESLDADIAKIAQEKAMKIFSAIKNGEPLLGGMNETIPEISTALNLNSWFIAVLQHQGLSSEKANEILDRASEIVSTNFMCSFVKAGVYMVESGMIPKPTMLVGATTPCDANIMLGQMMFNYKPWADVPKFIVDAPYKKEEADMAYFAKGQRDLVAFIEEHSGLKLDMDRLKEVCEEANRAYVLMQELQDLKRAVPCPVGWKWGYQAYGVARLIAPGKPEATAYMEKCLRIHEMRARAKKGIPGVNEKIRMVWFDVMPIWANKLFPRLENEFGAVNILDMYGYSPPFTLIDTSSEESMFRSFARRYLVENPMTRQTMAAMDMYMGDIYRIVDRYAVDVVVLPVHRGHKDMNACNKIVRDMCRERNIRFVTIGCDMFDERFMTADTVFRKLADYFEATGLA
jgi:benzoyl-CoA reductase subunit B